MREDIDNIIFLLQILHFREDLEHKLIQNLSSLKNQPVAPRDLENIYGERVDSELLKNTETILKRFGVFKDVNNQVNIDSNKLEKFIELLAVAKASRDYNWPQVKSKPFLYISPPTFISNDLSGDIDDISNLIVNLVSSSKRKISIMSPFTNKEGLKSVLAPLNACRNNPEIFLYLSVSEYDKEMISQQVFKLTPERMRKNITIYFCSTDTVKDDLPHAKVLVADSSKGYLGSANFTRQGLTSRFELGTELDTQQSFAVERLLDLLVSKGTFIKYIVKS